MAQFQPGQSGNPGGRPKMDPRLKEMALAKTAEAFAVVEEALASEDKKIALRAAEIIFDRAYGKPAQAIIGDASADPVQTAVRVVFGRD